MCVNCLTSLNEYLDHLRQQRPKPLLPLLMLQTHVTTRLKDGKTHGHLNDIMLLCFQRVLEEYSNDSRLLLLFNQIQICGECIGVTGNLSPETIDRVALT